MTSAARTTRLRVTFRLISRALGAEFAGSLILAAVVIGSGIMGARLSDGNDAIALLANTLATAAALYVLISALAPLSGAHFNPAVTFVALLRREIVVMRALCFMAAQVAGCVAGALLAHAMFELPLLQIASTERAGAAQLLSEGDVRACRVHSIGVPRASGSDRGRSRVHNSSWLLVDEFDLVR